MYSTIPWINQSFTSAPFGLSIESLVEESTAAAASCPRQSTSLTATPPTS